MRGGGGGTEVLRKVNTWGHTVAWELGEGSWEGCTMVKNSTLTHPDNDPTVKDFKEHTVLKNNFFYQYLEKNLRNKAKNKI